MRVRVFTYTLLNTEKRDEILCVYLLTIMELVPRVVPALTSSPSHITCGLSSLRTGSLARKGTRGREGKESLHASYCSSSSAPRDLSNLIQSARAGNQCELARSQII